MFHADVRVRRSLRLFVQLKSGFEMGRYGGPRPMVDEDRLDLNQAFIDLCAGCGDGSGLSRRSLTVRFGRQEMDFGSSRLVSAREGPNVGQSFDAVRAIVQARRWRIDGFVSRPVLTETGVFDDHPDSSRTFWGVYAVHRSDTARSGVDVYYLGLNHKGAQFDEGTADELRHTIGVRVWGTRGRLDYNFEPIWQGGTFGADAIRAWTVASDTGWQLIDPGHLRLGCRADVTSGDRNRTDGTLGTFNPLFPTGAFQPRRSSRTV
jgi:Alginate export